MEPFLKMQQNITEEMKKEIIDWRCIKSNASVLN